ncbi:MAG: hypothetical protein AAB296_08805, partial [Candidatus Desantisbacteria bacterium]
TSTSGFSLTTAGTQYTTGATYLGSTLTVGSTSTMQGLTVNVDGTITGDLTVNTTTTLNGDVVLGDTSADNITINGRLATTTWAGGTIIGGDISGVLDLTASGTSTLATTSITQLTTSGNSVFSGTFNVAGTSTLATTSVSYLTASVGGSLLGRFGIGTTTPYYSLDIQSTSGLGSFRIASSSVYNTLLIDNNGLMTFGLADNSSTSMTIQEGTSGTAYLTFDTTNDAEKIVVGKDLEIGYLNVDSNSGAVRFADMDVTSTAGTAQSLSIGLDGISILTVYAEATSSSLIGEMRVGIGTTTPVAMLTLIANASTTGPILKIATSTYNALWIDNMGLIGIGTSSSAFNLAIAGTQYTTGATYLGSTLNIAATSTQATTSITQL